MVELLVQLRNAVLQHERAHRAAQSEHTICQLELGRLDRYILLLFAERVVPEIIDVLNLLQGHTKMAPPTGREDALSDLELGLLHLQSRLLLREPLHLERLQGGTTCTSASQSAARIRQRERACDWLLSDLLGQRVRVQRTLALERLDLFRQLQLPHPQLLLLLSIINAIKKRIKTSSNPHLSSGLGRRVRGQVVQLRRQLCEPRKQLHERTGAAAAREAKVVDQDHQQQVNADQTFVAA